MVVILYVLLFIYKVGAYLLFAFITGDRGEPGDKGAKGYGLPGPIGDQGPKGNTPLHE